MAISESYFEPFRKNIIGHDLEHAFYAGAKKIIYADWAASGRLYRPIEEYITNELGPYVANTHTETTLTGTVMTRAYHQAQSIIKKHVNATDDDCLLFAGFGMTAAVNKFQRILGLRVPESYKNQLMPQGDDKPLVIITHMEHHSNQTSWEEAMVDVNLVRRKRNGLPDLDDLRALLEQNKTRKFIIGSFTACSNVTGIFTPYHEMAAIMHEYGRLCFVDFSASAPYVKIDMHPQDEAQRLDAIFFSPHKFLGGPGSSGVLIFNKNLYRNTVPDHPGGGTVLWTNPWGGHHYFNDIETREDGGTPGFLQAIRTGLAVKLKEAMNIEKMAEREHALKESMLDGLSKIPGLHILEPEQRHRLGYISFYVDNIHYNLIVRVLNEAYGIQTRGGCSCAGTYGHILLHINYYESSKITSQIDEGDLSAKPGWVRISLHPTMKDEDIEYIYSAVSEIVNDHHKWEKVYTFQPSKGDFERTDIEPFAIDLNRFEP